MNSLFWTRNARTYVHSDELIWKVLTFYTHLNIWMGMGWIQQESLKLHECWFQFRRVGWAGDKFLEQKDILGQEQLVRQYVKRDWSCFRLAMFHISRRPLPSTGLVVLLLIKSSAPDDFQYFKEIKFPLFIYSHYLFKILIKCKLKVGGGHDPFKSLLPPIFNEYTVEMNLRRNQTSLSAASILYFAESTVTGTQMQ